MASKILAIESMDYGIRLDIELDTGESIIIRIAKDRVNIQGGDLDRLLAVLPSSGTEVSIKPIKDFSLKNE